MDVAGLVSSIITFVDFSWTIVRGTYEVRSSSSGATEENVHVGNVLQDLRAVTEKMRTDIPGQSDHERALLELEHQCRGLSSELAAILQKLRVKSRSGLQSLNIMLRSLMKEKEVRGIEKRLGEYREQMILRLNLMLLERSVAMQNSLQLWQEVEPARLRDLKQEAEALTADNSILRRLYFDDMYKRADSITDATFGTFDWLLREPGSSSDKTEAMQISGIEVTSKPSHEERLRRETAAKISEFLEGSGGVFFLRGKPGSGKSTLMKHLISGRGKQEVDRKLQKWADQKRLIRVSAMFLLHGTPLQRSLEGFYRTLFFELICQCPDLEDELFPRNSKRGPGDSYTSSFHFESLQKAWQKLLSMKEHNEAKICVSIDGLDELEGTSGDRFRFARILKEWAESEDIKIICSGRPNAEFNTVFDQPHRLIDLQDLTRADIRKILEQRFEEVRHLSDLTQENVEELVNDISLQSEGVILWAVLVGKSLEDDVLHRKTLDAIKRTIRELPCGIENLFNEMLQEVFRNAQHQLVLRTICELLGHKGHSRKAMPLFWLEDALHDSEFPYNHPVMALEGVELNSRLEQVRSQLLQCTRHFVEVFNGSGDHPYLNAGCRFIHRSAQEFIQSKFNSIGPAPRRLDSDIVDLDLRLDLMFEMSLKRGRPTEGVSAFCRCRKKEKTYRLSPFHQLQPRLLDKLHEMVEVRRGLLPSDWTDSRTADEESPELGDTSYGALMYMTRVRSGPASLFHLALSGHQVDYITRMLNDSSQQLGQEDFRIGLLICAAGPHPSYELFNLLVVHGADPGCLVEVYRVQDGKTPVLIPLWLLVGLNLALDASMQAQDRPTPTDLKTGLCQEFLILERFLRLGYGFGVKFLVATGVNDQLRDLGVFDADEKDFFGVDLAQIVRFARPDNMNRLLLLLESPRATISSLARNLANFIVQPYFPFRTLPQGATTVPHRRVSDECLSREGWKVWAAFDGEHEIIKCAGYCLPIHG